MPSGAMRLVLQACNDLPGDSAGFVTDGQVAKQTGIKVLILPPSVGGVKGIDDYIQLMKYDMSQLANAVR